MSNAAKHRKKAAEFEQLKQIDRAIVSYVKAIEESESEGEEIDVALLNKVGDLTQRQGRVADAVTYYERAVEHYATAGLFNNAIALCNKILRSAPGRANVYFTLGRICAKKGLRGDATRNFLEYATRMQLDGRVDEGMRALAEVADLMPELTEVRRLVEEHAVRVGIALPRRKTPAMSSEAVPAQPSPRPNDKSSELVFLAVEGGAPPRSPSVATPPDEQAAVAPLTAMVGLESILLFDPTAQGPTSPSRDDRPEAERPNDAFAVADGSAPVARIDGFTTHDARDESIPPSGGAGPTSADDEGTELTWLTPLPDVVTEMPLVEFDLLDDDDGVASEPPVVAPMPDMLTEDFENVADDPNALVVRGGRAGTPAYTIGIHDERSPHLTPLIVSPIAELEAAIAAGAATAALEDARTDAQTNAQATTEIAPSRPPYRLDPHDFILPGELPPLTLEDDVASVDGALDASDERADRARDGGPETAQIGSATPAFGTVLPSAVDEDEGTVEAPDPRASRSDSAALRETESAATRAYEAPTYFDRPSLSGRHMRFTPALPISAVAIEANVVASARCEELRAAVARTPQDWALRRRLAEALFEVGERDAGLAELQAALTGFSQSVVLEAASDIADILVRTSPDSIQYHQKRVELAVRLKDPQRLRQSYLDLGDALAAAGDDSRAHAVYGRVLVMDPWDQRARAALGPNAPPAPPRPTPDDVVDLSDWLREVGPASTRMRMREPEISGDEQADFQALLRVFKDGVAKSLGDDDSDSHYDLGVAYKEMGLLDDAISEFQKALRDRKHRLPAYEALGQCFVEQSRYSIAATVLTRALNEPGPGDEHLIGVLYLIGYSCEALQRTDEARSYYSRVYATDINFRDVAARMAALDQIAL